MRSLEHICEHENAQAGGDYRRPNKDTSAFVDEHRVKKSEENAGEECDVKDILSLDDIL